MSNDNKTTLLTQFNVKVLTKEKDNETLDKALGNLVDFDMILAGFANQRLQELNKNVKIDLSVQVKQDDKSEDINTGYQLGFRDSYCRLCMELRTLIESDPASAQQKLVEYIIGEALRLEPANPHALFLKGKK